MAERGRILVADDDPLVQRAVTRVARSDYEVFQATTGADAERLAIELQPELIVLDIRFPDADGRDILARLKANPVTTHIPVLVWSGGDADSDREVTIGLGAEDYVEKMDAGTLLRKVARVLYRLRSERPAPSL